MDERGERDLLARRVRARRVELGLSVRAAAQAAEMDRNTWSYIEDASRKTSEFKYAGIERALRWEPGSVVAILRGGEPTPVKPAAVATQPDDEEIELVRTDPKLTPEMRERIITLILERREREKAAAIEDTRRMIDLFRQS
ncbi:helix-turn-helix domain-containing protein [Micromonospora sp. WMMA2032]|uniref:helix-turn-helix domain-containing protein n=1 Tax=Micromonospora sp. WMMA2032 TaxID=2039870 RepID=UPI0012FD25B1|nr:helix-turn-helix domain-containing protein [Micromonospora sp. WMMA2032]